MKKSIVFLMAIFLMAQGLYAQQAVMCRKDLPEITIGPNISLHFISPEPIQYVDISTNAIAGDLPLKNVLRLKIVPDSAKHFKVPGNLAGIVTIVGESFIAQYNLRYIDSPAPTVPAQVNILPEHTRPLEVPGITLTSKEIQDFALKILTEPTGGSLRKSNAYRLQSRLNHIYTAGDYIFLDITYFNRSNLSYQIDEQRFKIEDRKITKATNVQSVEISPVWQLYPNTSFKKRYRNVYVLKKATFPGNKVLNIELTEKQISGRVLTLQIKYGDILQADRL
ncbi:MAG: conjugative transposon protein TraN [Pedobacter sp.]|nr:MAG: conjugative transposon protein TraN [Pedobacter sp.]